MASGSDKPPPTSMCALTAKDTPGWRGLQSRAPLNNSAPLGGRGGPIRGRPTVRGKRTYGGRPGQRVEEQGTWAAQKHSEAGYGRPVDRGVWTAKTVKRPRQQPAHPQYANYWAPLTRKRHTMPHSAQSQHTNCWAPRMQKRDQQEHRPQRPTESSNPTQMRREEWVTVQGPVKEQQPYGMSHRGGGGGHTAHVKRLGQIFFRAFGQTKNLFGTFGAN